MKEMDSPELRVHRADVGDFKIYYSDDQWVLKHKDLFLAWSIRTENGWRVLEYSGACSDLADVVDDGLCERDAMIRLGDIAISCVTRAA